MPASTRSGGSTSIQLGQRTIGVVAEITYFRESLVRFLALKPYTIAVDLGRGDQESVERVVYLNPEILLVDSPNGQGDGLVSEIMRGSPDTRIVMLGVPEDEDLIVRLAEAGVAGFVTPDSSLESLCATIENASRAELACSPKIAAALLKRVAALSKGNGVRRGGPPLTMRENQIIQMIDRGLSNKEIAAQLNIGPGTVKTHVHHILEKFAVHRRGEAAACVERATSRLKLLRSGEAAT